MQNIDFLFEGDAYSKLQDARIYLEDNLPASIIPYLKEANIRIRNVSSPSCTFSIHSQSIGHEQPNNKPLVLITFDLTISKLCNFNGEEKSAIILHEIGHTINPYSDKTVEGDEQIIKELLTELNNSDANAMLLKPRMANALMFEVYADFFVKYCIPRRISVLTKALDSVQSHKLAPGLEHITEIRKLALKSSHLFFQEGGILNTLIRAASQRNVMG